MTLWDLREHIEKAIPAWTVVVPAIWFVPGLIAAIRGRAHGGFIFWVIAGPLGLLFQLFGTV